MRKLSCLISAVAAVTLLGCSTPDPGDPFDTQVTTVSNETTGDGDGDGDGDPGDGDGSPGDGDGSPGDGDGDECGGFGAACSGETCCEGLNCQGNGTCGVGGDGDGDPGDGDGDLGECAGNDEYCLGNGCQGSQGQALVIDTDMNGSPDLGWCLFACTMDNECPAIAGGNAMVSCQVWNMDGDMACFPLCTPNVTQCPEGATCFPIGGGAGVCAYDAEGFG